MRGFDMWLKTYYGLLLWVALSLSNLAEAYPEDAAKGPNDTVIGEPAEASAANDSAAVVGKRVPGFWTYTAAGQITHISDQGLRGKWILVEFWSSEVPKRDKAQDRLAALRKEFLADERLLFLSVCVDLELDAWMKYVDSQKDLETLDGGRVKFYSDRRWWQLCLGVNDPKDTQELLANYGMQKMPHYFLVQPDETLAAGNIAPDKLKDVLVEHLEKQGAGKKSERQ